MLHDFQSDTALADIRTTLQRFQDGYTRRDPALLDAFMELFVSDDGLEVLGTSAVDVSGEEWCRGPIATRALIAADWESWGDLTLDVAGAHLAVNGPVAWLATTGTVSQRLPLEHNYVGIARFLQGFGERQAQSAGDIEDELLQVILGAASALSNHRRGDEYIWPLRLTAVLVRQADAWRFWQLHFSYPTVHLPQVRL